ncbi:hypothetical protein [Thioalkalivibrio paradoxus]|uniref:Uncharacterized protein n=1 Tax=Thioalkalivibrio paradoxus ARh 1 TaxID=713585 RepID=W0DP78_9GAMM|nr:hypothetical protein [Thioalkalivibrio paradoxus]AHF00257.1 hypothetical protein THITH_14080 [Thioalkalivibrio paradoxus ARh 1]
MNKRAGLGLLYGWLALLLVSAGVAHATERLEVIEVDGQVERAAGPAELLDMASGGHTTVRALRAFGRLPDEFGALALSLRGAGVDLLAAGIPEVEALQADAEAGRLDADPDALERLLALLQEHDYLDWAALQAGHELEPAGPGLLRGEGRAVLRDAGGTLLALELHGGVRETRGALEQAEAGPSASPDADDRLALGRVAADRDGVSRDAPALSEPALALREALDRLFTEPGSPWVLGGEIGIDEHPDGRIGLLLPSLTLEAPDDVTAELGDLAAELRPLGSERWEVTVQLPGDVPLRDRKGDLAARISIGERSMSGVWAGDLASPLQLAVHLGDLVLESEAPTAALDPEQPGRLDAQRLALTLDLDEREPGVVTGPLAFVVEGVSLASAAAEPIGHLGRLSVGVDYEDVDLAGLAAFGDMAAAPETLMERDPAELLSELLTALGGMQSRIEVEDLAVQAPPGEVGHLRVARAALNTGFVPSAAGELKRDLWANLEGRGWSFGDEEYAFDLDAAEWNLRLDRIAPMTLLQLGLASLMTGELAEDDLIASAQEILGGFSVGLSLHGANGQMVAEYLADEPPFGLEQFEFGLGLSDLDTPAPGVSLAYRHRGIAGLPMGMTPIPDELFPQELVLDLVASRLPGAFLADGAALQGAAGNGAEIAQDAMAAMLENDTRIDIQEFVIDLPVGGLRLHGNSWVDTEEVGSGVLRSEMELQIRNFDTLLDLALELADNDQERQQIMGIATILKMAGEERENDAGEPVHFYHLHANSLGEFQVNGHDLGMLLMDEGH